MQGFSTVDGFVEISECMAEMIKYVANEPSVGLFYVQQHIQNAAPNVINLKKNIAEKSHETSLHTEDAEDSITMVRSLKDCGFPIADEMIKDIRKSLGIMAAKQPKRGLINSPSSSSKMGKTASWGPATWRNNGVFSQQDSKKVGDYFSNVFKTAKERASNFKWPQLDSKEMTLNQGQKVPSYPNLPQSVASASSSLSLPDVEADELPLSSHTLNELQEDKEEKQVDVDLPPHDLLLSLENYDNFKADKEAKLEVWLDGTGDKTDKSQESK